MRKKYHEKQLRILILRDNANVEIKVVQWAKYCMLTTRDKEMSTIFNVTISFIAHV